jgi:hypothetical protein
MDGRAFLESARLLMATPTEANRRSAVGRAYYAALNETRAALARWGFSVPPGVDVEEFVNTRFYLAMDMDAVRVSDVLVRLQRNREIADYSLTEAVSFADESMVRDLLLLAEIGIDLLDQIEADPVRRAKAVAAIRKAFP